MRIHRRPLVETITSEIVLDATEKDLYKVDFPANWLPRNKVFVASLLGDYLNNTGSDKTFTLRAYIGATKVYDDASPAIPDNVSRRGFYARVVILSPTSSSQIFTTSFRLGTPGTTAGLNDLGVALHLDHQALGEAAIDGNTETSFRLTWQHSANATSLSVRLLSAKGGAGGGRGGDPPGEIS